MTYNELLNKLSSGLSSASVKAGGQRPANDTATTSKEDTTSIMLNKIGLEVQRQGGF